MSIRNEVMVEIKIPEGTKIEIEDSALIVSGSLGRNRRVFNSELLSASIDSDKLVISALKEKKLAKKSGNAAISLAKEIQNDIKGVNKYYEINMKAVFAHFPLSIEVKGSDVYINNLFGERVPRIAHIVGSTKVEVKGQAVLLKGTSLDDVTQSAANIRKACIAKNKDIRVFQDGIYYAEE